jgi:alpha-methylacyl-CoA racemase
VPPTEGPLDGVTVLDLSAVGPGSRCTAALRDLGAAVTKVGAPSALRRLEPRFFAYGGGRGLRRIRIDVQAQRGRDVFLRLAARSDVVVESFRPGVADRLGIGYKDVRAANPAAVYCAITGYGQTGPYAAHVGHDLNYLAVGGFLSTQGRRADGGPAIPGATIADSAAGGLHAALAITAALLQRASTGEGTYLDVATADGVVQLMSLFVDEYLATGVEVGPASALLTGRYACYDSYRTADGKWLAVGAIEPGFFANLCRALGRPELAADQYDVVKQDALRAAVADAFARRSRDEWVRELAPLDTCVSPVLTVAEVTEAEQFGTRQLFMRAVHPDVGEFRQVAPAIAGAARPLEPVQLPGKVTHADVVLGAAGFTQTEIEDLRMAGVVE